MQRAVYIIKPEGMPHESAIREALLETGLKIISSKRVILDETAVDTLYPDVSHEIRIASIKFLTNAPSEIGILEGEGAFAKLQSALGSNTNPDDCGSGTIRHRFGVRPGVVIGKSIYYRNALHGSKDAVEADRDLRLYCRLAPAPCSLSVAHNRT